MMEIVSMQGRITIDSADQMRRRLANALRTHPALVAVDRRDRVLAFAWATPFRARSAYRATVEDSVYVDGRARGVIASAMRS